MDTILLIRLGINGHFFKMKIWLNGKFVKEEEAKVDITSSGFLYGQGVFETMRAYNERVFRLDSHLEQNVGSSLKTPK